MPCGRCDRSTRGFTLVELLVVVAVVSVLVGMLLPVVGRAREKARQVVCASNIRQVGLALRLYSDDHDTILPPSTTRIPGGHFSTPFQGHLDIVWWDLVLPYLGNARVLYCPSAPQNLPTYHGNSHLLWSRSPASLDDCTDPSSTILLTEYLVPTNELDAVYIPARSVIRLDVVGGRCFYHFGRMNVCFSDGHVNLLGEQDVGAGSPLWDVWR